MSTRVDSWIWAIRLTKTRSAAGTACRGGHVRVNGAPAKPATNVVVGDEVRVRIGGRERIVEVTKLISKRVSAPMAAECYIDRSPPPPSPELIASLPRRDRGAGRPTKRDRREMDKLRGVNSLMIGLVAVVALVLTGCSGSDDDSSSSSDPEQGPETAQAGPTFDRCGGVSTEEVIDITGFAGLRPTVENSSVCEWDASVDRTGPVASFNWYRGSPIGREEANVKLSRDVTRTIEIGGHSGFIGYTEGICEVGIGFGDDFFEWSISSQSKELNAKKFTVEELCAAAEELSRLAIERAS